MRATKAADALPNCSSSGTSLATIVQSSSCFLTTAPARSGPSQALTTGCLAFWSSLCTAAAFARQPSGSQQPGGPYLGLEPGLGITTPLLDQHKHGKSAAGTPSSVAASESARPFGGLPASPPGGGTAAAAAAAAEAAASIAAAGASVAQAAAAEAESKKELSVRQMQNSVLYGKSVMGGVSQRHLGIVGVVELACACGTE